MSLENESQDTKVVLLEPSSSWDPDDVYSKKRKKDGCCYVVINFFKSLKFISSLLIAISVVASSILVGLVSTTYARWAMEDLIKEIHVISLHQAEHKVLGLLDASKIHTQLISQGIQRSTYGSTLAMLQILTSSLYSLPQAPTFLTFTPVGNTFMDLGQQGGIVVFDVVNINMTYAFGLIANTSLCGSAIKNITCVQAYAYLLKFQGKYLALGVDPSQSLVISNMFEDGFIGGAGRHGELERAKKKDKPIAALYILPVDTGGGLYYQATFSIMNSMWTNGQVSGIVSLDFHIGRLSSILDEIKVMSRGKLAIMLENGTLIAASSTKPSLDRDYPIGNYYYKTNVMKNVKELDFLPLVRDGSIAMLKSSNGNISTKVLPKEVVIGSYESNGIQALYSFTRLDYLDSVTYFGTFLERKELYESLDTLSTVLPVLCVAFALVLSILVGFIIRALIHPFTRLQKRLDKVTRLDFSGDKFLDIFGRYRKPGLLCLYELREMQLSVSSVETAIDAFSKYLSRSVVRMLLDPNRTTLTGLGMKEVDVSIYFSDIAGFADATVNLSADDLVSVIGEYLQEMSMIIVDFQGTIDKYIGDSIMAFWNAPHAVVDFVTLSIHSAVRCQQRLVELRPLWLSRGLPELSCRIGINCGRVLVGNFGCKFKMDYTIIGDPVNLASRLEGLNKKYNTSIMASEEVYNSEQVKEKFLCRPLGKVIVKGKSQPTTIYEIIGLLDEVSEQTKRCVNLYSKAIKNYFKRNFKEALIDFQKYNEICYSNQKCDNMIQSCKNFITLAPPPQWDGVDVLNEKY